jgi:glycosyltransferase involved in cell wall biosynthesis
MTIGNSLHWCFITPEYPPTVGGVADYTRLVATHLMKAGQPVSVLAPTRGQTPIDNGLDVQPVLGEFGPIGFWRGSKVLDGIPRPRRLFLQWVPHGFAFKSMNLLLVLWIWWRVVVRHDQLWIMAHEPFLAFEHGFKQRLAACVHRGMVWVLLRLSGRAFAGNQLWIKTLSLWCPRGLTIEWLPVPSTLPLVDDLSAMQPAREKWAGATGLIGHFGTFGAHTREVLGEPLRLVLDRSPGVRALLLGKNGDLFLSDWAKDYPHLADRVTAPGKQDLGQLSIGLLACDLMLQAYGGGISTRNTSLMAILQHGKPLVATRGHVTDPEWDDWDVVELAQAGDSEGLAERAIRLLENQSLRQAKGAAGKELYEKLFSINRLIGTLLAG